MARFNVNRETLFRGEFIDEVEVPDEIVAAGKMAIRDFLKDVSMDTLELNLEIEEDRLVFEQLEDE